MWIIRNFVWLLLICVLGWFMWENMPGRVSEIHIIGTTFRELPVIGVVFTSFVIGMFLAFVINSIHYLKGRAAMRKLTRENQNLKEELRALRNLPLEDLKLGEEAGVEG